MLRGLNDDCIDLVYADPPFKTERRYTAADSSNAAGAGFRDTWRRRDEEPADREAMARTDPAAVAVIDASAAAHGGGMRAYLVVCPRNGFTHRCPWPTGPRPAILLVPIEGCPWSLRNLNRKIVSGTYH